MRNLLKLFLVFVIVLCISVAPVSAAQYPHLTKYVNDFAGILSTDTIDALNEQCAGIERNTSYEIAIVTVRNTGGEDVVIYAARMSDASGVGNAETDSGITVMFSQDNVAGLALATGRGSGDVVTDVKAYNILKRHTDEFDNMDYNAGFRDIVNELDALLPHKGTGKLNVPKTQQAASVWGITIIYIVSAFLIVYVVRRK